MEKLRQCYETLGITPGASVEEIKQAYKDSVKVWHPDRFENDPRLKLKAQEKIKEINAAYEKIANYFKEYGTPNFAKPDYQKPQEPQEPPKEDRQGRQRESSNTESVDITSYYKAAIGKNTEYYLPIFERFDRDGKTSASWNWAAFFGNWLWCCYRRMYLNGILFLALTMLSGVFQLASEAVMMLVLSATGIAFGMYSNALYYKSISKKIGELNKGDTNSSGPESLRNNQPNKTVVYAFAALFGLSIIVMLAIAIPQYNAPAPAALSPDWLYTRIGSAKSAPAPAVEAPKPDDVPAIQTDAKKKSVWDSIPDYVEPAQPKSPESGYIAGSGFIIENDVVTDTSTGLMWARNGNIAGRKMNWKDASNWVNKLNYGGYTDWRLPTIMELEPFSELGGKRPSEWFNANGFSSVQSDGYWSRSYPDKTEYFAVMFMDYGRVFVQDKSVNHYVWPVRSGR